MNRILTALCIICFSSSLSCGQPAPNFIITTSDGGSLDLYADVLDEGKAAMVEIMFTTCPPCSLVAPFLQPLYEEWGEGNGPVEFISLSDKSFDSNADVAAWKANWDMTFKGAGEDGGSLAAVAPYKAGNWGPFFGTPTFIVIAPDRSVQFDIRGPNNLATIDSISVAIERALDTMLVQDPPFLFQGRVRRLPPDTIGIPNVEFTLVSPGGNTPLSGSTDNEGNYLFEFDPGTLSEGDVLRPTYNHEVPAIQAITAFDLVLVQRHLLGINPFADPLDVLKADVNDDGTINILDVIDMRKLILGVAEDWVRDEIFIFASTGEVGQPDGTLLPHVDRIPIVDGVYEYMVDFYLLKVGDVSDSYQY